MRLRTLVAAVFAHAFVEGAAHAGPAGKPYRVTSYSVHAGCPSRTGLVAAIHQRLDSAVVDESAPLGLEVTIERNGSSSHGVLVADDGALRTVREVDAKTCAEVVDALAFIAVVAIENAALKASVPEEEPAPPPPPESSEAPPKAAEPPKKEPPPVVAKPPRVASPMSVSPSLAVGIDGFAMYQIATSTALSATLGLSFFRPTGLSPAFILTVTRTSSLPVDALDSAHARWTSVRSGVCPHVFTPSASTQLTGCLTFTTGQLEASARSFDEVPPLLRPWLVVGALARLTTWFGPVGQGLELGVDAPIRRDRLVSGVNGKEVSIPATYPFLGVFVAVRIP